MDRRSFLAGGTATLALGSLTAPVRVAAQLPPPPAGSPPEDAPLNAAFDAILADTMLNAPTFATA